MKRKAGAVVMVRTPKCTLGAPVRRPLALAVPPMLLAAAIVFPTGPAAAACVQAGNAVTCSGTTNTAVGTGAENNLTVTVQPGASINLGPGQIAINLANGNTALNNGAISVGPGSWGMKGLNNNSFTNSGLITGGDGFLGMVAQGTNNVLTNAGTMSSTGVNSFGFDIVGTANTVTNSGTITMTGAGSGGMFDNGSGNTFQNSGTITVDAKGVVLQIGSTLSNSGTITAVGASGIGVLDASGNSITNSGTISATGTVGVGMTFANNNQIVNDGTIRGGLGGYSLFAAATGNTVTNNGTLDGAMFVSSPIGGNALINGGLITITDASTPLAAGNLAFAGAFTQTAQGTLALRVDNTGAHDGLAADGAVNLNGTLRAVLQPGLYQSSTTYVSVVQNTAPIAGQFASVTSSSAFFNAVATYNATSVDLTLTRYGFGAAPGETSNQRAVGNALEAGYATSLSGTAAAFYANLLQAGSVRVLDALSGEGTSGTQNAAFTAGAMFGQTMDGQMTAWLAGNRVSAASSTLGYAEERPSVASAFNAVKAPPLTQPIWNAWVAGFGAGQSLSGDANVGSANFSDRVAGGAIGVDRLIGPDLLVGIAAGGSSATFSVDDRATYGRLDGGHVGAYAMQRLGAGYVSAQIAYSHFNNTTTRFITGVGPDETAKAAFGSDQLGGRLEVGQAFTFNALTVTPFAAVQAARLWQAAYTEISTAGVLPGMLALSYAAKGVSSLPTFLGTKLDGRFDFGNGMVWMPFLHASWVHEFDPTRDVTASLPSLSLPSFTVEGARAAGDSGRVELGSRLALNRWWELSARATGEFSRAGQTYTGMGSLRVSW